VCGITTTIITMVLVSTTVKNRIRIRENNRVLYNNNIIIIGKE